MSTALSIAFTGLCALVTDSHGGPADILLVDAQVGEVRGMTLPRHTPMLVANMRDVTNADSSGPSRVIVTPQMEQLGIWELSGSEVRIRVQGADPTGVRIRPPSAKTSWPEPPQATNDPESWGDLRFVAEMAAISGDGRVDPSLVADGGLAPMVGARVRLDAGMLQAGVPSQDVYRREVFEFRGPDSERIIRQALTDTIQWSLQSDAAAIVIEIVSPDGRPTKQLLFAPSALPHQVFVSNLPSENELTDTGHALSTDEDMGALHFGIYYHLLQHPPAVMSLPILSPVSRRGTSGIRPAYCPPIRLTKN